VNFKGDAVDETQQLIAVIRNKNTSIETLNILLRSVNAQMPMSERALNLLNKSEPDTYTHDLHQEVLRIGSGGKTGSLTRKEFDSMLP
jgi:hypothetical protein